MRGVTMDQEDKKKFIKYFKKTISEKLPEIKETANDINYLKYKTQYKKGYLPKWKIEKNNTLIHLMSQPYGCWTNDDLKIANSILKYYKQEE